MTREQAAYVEALKDRNGWTWPQTATNVRRYHGIPLPCYKGMGDILKQRVHRAKREVVT